MMTRLTEAFANKIISTESLHEPSHDACGVGLLVSGSREPSHRIVLQALKLLKGLSHRGACGADGRTGDGAGILLSIPHAFLAAQPEFIGLPKPGEYGAGVLFLPKDHALRLKLQTRFAEIAKTLGLEVLGWRDIPVDSIHLGDQARSREPFTSQVILVPPSRGIQAKDLSRKLFQLRRRAEQELKSIYIVSLSEHTLVYKGLLLPNDLPRYFPELTNPQLTASFAMVHSRFSTNTSPAWEMAHPFRLISHNGEINTLRGNLNSMQARAKQIIETLYPDQPAALKRPIPLNLSDSQSLDEGVSLLIQGGMSLPEALMTLIPEAWEKNPFLPEPLRQFYQAQALKTEPWDGPAAVCFADGKWAGAVLDRSGLRPCRYQVLHDGTLIIASEAGVLEFNDSTVAHYGRLGPGQIIAYDLVAGRLLWNEEVKSQIAGGQKTEPRFSDLEHSGTVMTTSPERLTELLKRFGYTREELTTVVLPLFKGEEAHSSMGNDTPLAVLSDLPQPLFRFFRQMFAQVTNPPIDAIREEMVMSLTTYLGPHAKLFQRGTDHLQRWKLPHPVLDAATAQALKEKAQTLDTLFDPNEGLEAGLKKLCQRAEQLAKSGACLLYLTDMDVSTEQAAIPSLLAVSAVHHHLLNLELRIEVSLILETAEARDVHHFACLLGYGVDAIHAYLGPALADHFVRTGSLDKSEDSEAMFAKAICKGLLKIFSKMGISTLQSYRGAQIFEIIGLSDSVVESYFPMTPSHLGGLSLQDIEFDTLRRHRLADRRDSELAMGGDVHFRAQGEEHFWSPGAIAHLQQAVRLAKPESYEEFVKETERTRRFHIRGLLDFNFAPQPIPLEEVESATEILRRFTTGAMSLGALGREAHESLAIAMNRIGAKSNSGEGGEDLERFQLPGKNSAIKQVASARFGVTIEYLNNAQELQIKMAQGAKPGEGGQLPGHKVDAYIAKMRHSTPGVTLISPPPHHDIYSIEDLAQLIFDLKQSNPHARVSVKLVAETGVGTIAAGVAKAGADKIVISGDSGGTGASPLSSIKYAGSPWEIGLAEAQQALIRYGFRDRVVLETDGQLKTGRDVAIAAILGAEEFGFSTAPLIAQGCIMMRKCHLNTCPVGIATQDPVLRARFSGQPEYVIQYFHFVAEEIRILMSRLGLRRFSELIGQTHLLKLDTSLLCERTNGLDVSKLLAPATCLIPGHETYRHFLSKAPPARKTLDENLLRLCNPALERGEKVKFRSSITNSDRAVGTWLSGYIARKRYKKKLEPGLIHLQFTGAAGQSFGAFLAQGITLSLKGLANDYVGKGLSGGTIQISPPWAGSKQGALVGNTCLYGATSGEAYIAGAAGERFAVRNSGAIAVVESVGDHGCEYMTGGMVLVLGETGRNFAAGMSGGLAFVFDDKRTLSDRCNLAGVEVETVRDGRELKIIFNLLESHLNATGSVRAKKIILDWEQSSTHFMRVLPKEYKPIWQTRSSTQNPLDFETAVAHG